MLGVYALCSVGWALFNFSDCEAASKELQTVRHCALVMATWHGMPPCTTLTHPPLLCRTLRRPRRCWPRRASSKCLCVLPLGGCV